MTGLELLKAEMKKKGCTASQINSQVVSIVLDILSKSDGEFLRLNGLEKEIKDKAATLRSLEWRIDNKRREQREMEQRMNEQMDSLREYAEQFNDGLKRCESPEGRDRLKRAQIFVNTVEVGTKYDNTAFIIGLSAILAEGPLDGPEELKKINPRLFERSR